MNIVLFGSPGAGKGTQANNLVKDFNLIKISSGDLLREEIKKKSLLGDKIKLIVDSGSLVSNEIINNLIEITLINKNYFDRIIFDGFPRNLSQAKTLDVLMEKYKQKISCVISLKVNENVVVKRILGRQICSKCGLIFNEFFNPSTKENHKCDLNFLLKRSDDNEKTIKNSLAIYQKETLSIFNYYKSQNLLFEIDGMKNIDEIYKKICQIINSIEA